LSHENKIVIVTGGGSGIGRAYVTALAKANAKVVIADIDEQPAHELAHELTAAGHEVIAIRTDVTSEQDTLSMAAETVAKFGTIDVLVNNAGIFPQSEFLDLTYAHWRKVLAVNLDGPFLCCKAVAPEMVKNKRGKIINISTECFFMGFETLVDYTAAKAGVVGLTRALARSLGRHGINVNTITPGLTASDALLRDQPENFDSHVARQCLNRVQRPDDLVGALMFLASPASDMVTGQIINVDGGFNLH
jgi:3-oxoacyl-[acyl-carrier protein] reductase